MPPEDPTHPFAWVGFVFFILVLLALDLGVFHRHAHVVKFREAMGQLVLGAMSYTERQGLIRFRRGLTYRDYLRALAGRASPREAFQSLVQAYEPVCFGRREATAEHYESVLAAYRTGIQNA